MFNHYYRPPASRQHGQGLGSLLKMAVPFARKMFPVIKGLTGKYARKHAPRLIKTGSKIAYRTLKSRNKKATAKRELEKAVARQINRAMLKPQKSRPYKGRAKRPRDIFG